MKFNPEMLIRLVQFKNPQLYQQFLTFQKSMESKPEVMKQFNDFKQNMVSSPSLQEKAYQEATAMINNMSNAPTTINNSEQMLK